MIVSTFRAGCFSQAEAAESDRVTADASEKRYGGLQIRGLSPESRTHVAPRSSSSPDSLLVWSTEFGTLMFRLADGSAEKLCGQCTCDGLNRTPQMARSMNISENDSHPINMAPSDPDNEHSVKCATN